MDNEKDLNPTGGQGASLPNEGAASSDELDHILNVFADPEGKGSVPPMDSPRVIYEAGWIDRYFWNEGNPHSADEWYGFFGDDQLWGDYSQGINDTYSGIFLNPEILDGADTLWGTFENKLRTVVTKALGDPNFGSESYYHAGLSRMATRLEEYQTFFQDEYDKLWTLYEKVKPGNESFEGATAAALARHLKSKALELKGVADYLAPVKEAVNSAAAAADPTFADPVVKAYNEWASDPGRSPRQVVRTWWEENRDTVTKQDGFVYIGGKPTDSLETWRGIEQEMKDLWWSKIENLRNAASENIPGLSKSYANAAGDILPYTPITTERPGGGGSGSGDGNGGSGDGPGGDFDFDELWDEYFGDGDSDGGSGDGDGGSGEGSGEGSGDDSKGGSGDGPGGDFDVEEYLDEHFGSSGDGSGSGAGPGGSGDGPGGSGEGSGSGSGEGVGSGSGQVGGGPGGESEYPPPDSSGGSGSFPEREDRVSLTGSSSGDGADGSSGDGAPGGSGVVPPLGTGTGGLGGLGGSGGGGRDRGRGSGEQPGGGVDHLSSENPWGDRSGDSGTGSLGGGSLTSSTDGADAGGGTVDLPPPPERTGVQTGGEGPADPDSAGAQNGGGSTGGSVELGSSADGGGLPGGSEEMPGSGGSGGSGGSWDLGSSADGGGLPGGSEEMPGSGGSGGSGGAWDLGSSADGGGLPGGSEEISGSGDSGASGGSWDLGSSSDGGPLSGGSVDPPGWGSSDGASGPGSSSGERPLSGSADLTGGGGGERSAGGSVDMPGSGLQGSGPAGVGADGLGGTASSGPGASALGGAGAPQDPASGYGGGAAGTGGSGTVGAGGSGAGAAAGGGGSGSPMMPPMMPPMGGGAGAGGPQQERTRSTWLTEDENVWGTADRGGPAVLGRPGVGPGKGATGLGHVPAGADGARPRTASADPAESVGGKRKPGIGQRGGRVQGPDGQREGERER
ncbi:hypothetical protein [Nocardiopsis baichengensis]|uniref:hypothetical protein n=1 Tax=Nocardiopsis baichengensis TaxID=280240 RepID=UPI000344EA87|nr:hypothetical protein [Nocardiopsis baichengensis]